MQRDVERYKEVQTDIHRYIKTQGYIEIYREIYRDIERYTDI